MFFLFLWKHSIIYFRETLYFINQYITFFLIIHLIFFFFTQADDRIERLYLHYIDLPSSTPNILRSQRVGWIHKNCSWRVYDQSRTHRPNECRRQRLGFCLSSNETKTLFIVFLFQKTPSCLHTSVAIGTEIRGTRVKVGSGALIWRSYATRFQQK